MRKICPCIPRIALLTLMLYRIVVLLNIFTFSSGKEPSAEDPEVVTDSRPPRQLSLNLGENKVNMCVSQDVLFVYWSWPHS